MTQQINLYQSKTKTKSSIDLQTLFHLYVIFFFLLILLFAYVSWMKHSQTKDVKMLTQRNILADAKLKELKNKYPSFTIEGDPKQSPCRTKFSLYMEGFAKAIATGVWLTEITINDNGKHLSLRGFGLESIQVQQFLTQLTQQEIFKTVKFELQEINEITKPLEGEESGVRMFNFIISNK